MPLEARSASRESSLSHSVGSLLCGVLQLALLVEDEGHIVLIAGVGKVSSVAEVNQNHDEDDPGDEEPHHQPHSGNRVHSLKGQLTPEDEAVERPEKAKRNSDPEDLAAGVGVERFVILDATLEVANLIIDLLKLCYMFLVHRYINVLLGTIYFSYY